MYVYIKPNRESFNKIKMAEDTSHQSKVTIGSLHYHNEDKSFPLIWEYSFPITPVKQEITKAIRVCSHSELPGDVKLQGKLVEIKERYNKGKLSEKKYNQLVLEA